MKKTYDLGKMRGMDDRHFGVFVNRAVRYGDCTEPEARAALLERYERKLACVQSFRGTDTHNPAAERKFAGYVEHLKNGGSISKYERPGM